jgi:putative transposase
MRIPLIGERPAMRGEVIQLSSVIRSPWQMATDKAKATALTREVLALHVEAEMRMGCSQNLAVDLLLARIADGRLPVRILDAARDSAKAGRTSPSRSQLCEWVKSYREEGVSGLLPQHKGRVRMEGGWEGMALELYSQPSKPDMSSVHRQITEVHGIRCSYEQVKGYLNALPSNLGKMSPARIGKKLYKLTEKAWVERCTTNLLPGDVYMADGYRADVYLSHPSTGDIWRPEIMHIIDLRSRVMVGYRIMAHEGGYDVMIGWAETFERWGHVPPILYVDNGSGFKNKLTEDASASYYSRAGVQYVIYSIPHNPHGKGHIERYNRIVKDDFLKMWMPDFYCGDDAAPDNLIKVVNECKAGRMIPPTVQEFIAAYNDWIVRYNNRPHPEEKHRTRLEIWRELSPIAPHASAREIARPSVHVKVLRAKVRFKNRHYSHPDLHAWNDQEVLLEYDLLNDALVMIRTLKGELICDALLVAKIDTVPVSFLEETRQKALVNATKRLEKKIDEQKARAGLLIDADAVADGAQALEGEALLIEVEDEVLLDLTLDDTSTGDEA